jgi:adenylate cyclase
MMTRTPDAATGPGAAVVQWMLHEGRRYTQMRTFGDALCQRMVDDGLPICRGFCALRTLHPLVYATAYVWRRGEGGAVRFLAEHGMEKTPAFANSPLIAVQRNGEPVRRRLCDPDCPLDFDILPELKEAGVTDYVALPMQFSGDVVNGVSWATDQAGGFSAREIAGLEAVTEVLALIVELQSQHRIGRTLLNTYVGRRTGGQVLDGRIQRGDIETIGAAIWYCDLRDFTATTDRLPGDAVVALLNDYFACMAAAVQAQGGEVLKFIGDAMLAIFPLDAGDDATPVCAAALDAARAAAADIAALNRERAARPDAAPPIRFGLALHLGDVQYGNIGAPDRLDFTVIGPAVNHAARIEGLCKTLDRAVLVSESFAAQVPSGLVDLGPQALRGIARPQRVFALDESS